MMICFQTYFYQYCLHQQVEHPSLIRNPISSSPAVTSTKTAVAASDALENASQNHDWLPHDQLGQLGITRNLQTPRGQLGITRNLQTPRAEQ